MSNNLLQDLLSDNSALTASIQKVFFLPGQIATDKVFHEDGMNTTSAYIEFENGIVMLIPSAPRGGVAEPLRMGERSGIYIEAIHLPHSSSLMADAVQNRREFGSVDAESVNGLLKRKLSAMRSNLETTIEFHRLCAIKGKIMDADGLTVLVDIYSEFGKSQTEKSLALDTAGSRLLNKVISAQRAVEEALGGTPATGFLAYAAPDFMDALRAHPDFVAELQYARPSEMSADYRSGILIGDVTFKEYRSTIGGLTCVEPGTAYMFPLGVPELFISRFGPADYVDTVNTKGQPIYARAEAMPMSKGYWIEAQSNVISLCTRPEAVIKLTAV